MKSKDIDNNYQCFVAATTEHPEKVQSLVKKVTNHPYASELIALMQEQVLEDVYTPVIYSQTIFATHKGSKYDGL